MRPKRDDRRLLFDTRRVMQATAYRTVIEVAIQFQSQYSTAKNVVEAETDILLEIFNETGVVPEYIVDFCLDVQTGKIPIVNSRGDVINKKRR